MSVKKVWNGTAWGGVTQKRFDAGTWRQVGFVTVAATALRQFTDRTYVATESRTAASATTLTARTVHKVRATASAIYVLYSNCYATTHTVGCAVEVGGVLYQLTAAGQAKVALAPGAYATFGPLSATVEAGAALPVRTFYSMAAGANIPFVKGTKLDSVLGEGESAEVDLTLPNSGAVSGTGSAYGYGPLSIRGQAPTSAVSVAALGDSIGESGNDYGGHIRAFIARALDAAQRPFTNYAKWGQAAAHMYSAGTKTAAWDAQVGTTLDGSTHVICAYGRNDMTATLTDIKATFIGLWGLAAADGRKVWQTTVTPSSTSTDVWATVASQTVTGNNPTRVAFNDWIRDGAPMIGGVGAVTGTTDPAAIRAGATGHSLKGFIEVTDTVESARNSGLWKAGTLTDDGVHPTAAGHIAMAAPVQTWAAGLTV